MDQLQSNILKEIAGIEDLPQKGAYNVRINGKSAGRNNSENISISPKEGGTGIDIRVNPNTLQETVYIPVVLSAQGHQEKVYNDFYIGKNAEVLIVAGCGIHSGCGVSQHDGVHSFYLEEGAKVRYVERHYGEGGGQGKRILNPVTYVSLEKGSYMEMDTVQIKGVDSTIRITRGTIGAQATLVVKEKLLTHGSQTAQTEFYVELDGENSSVSLSSRSVAQDASSQKFISVINGNNLCHGHSECDAILMGEAAVSAVPNVTANHPDAQLIHEAAIGKIAGEQIMKLMTLGLTQEEAEMRIIEGFLK